MSEKLSDIYRDYGRGNFSMRDVEGKGYANRSYVMKWVRKGLLSVSEKGHKNWRYEWTTQHSEHRHIPSKYRLTEDAIILIERWRVRHNIPDVAYGSM